MSEPNHQAALIEMARAVRLQAYAPYSDFPVGAAVACRDGRVFTGCNVENASYGLCICAERTAIFSAIAAGAREFTRIAVIADTPGPCRPCGACRQVIAEFLDADAEVIMASVNGAMDVRTVRQLLPEPFDKSCL
ncbi:MAG: cytidine deaminase [Blastocatellia bacterium]